MRRRRRSWHGLSPSSRRAGTAAATSSSGSRGLLHRHPRRSRVPLLAVLSGVGGGLTRGATRRPLLERMEIDADLNGHGDPARVRRHRPRRRHGDRAAEARPRRPGAREPQGRAPALPKFLALPVFSSDALSSIAYATEEMMLVLVTAGAGALAFRIPIAIAIATVLVIVVVSYRQTVRAYPGGGGRTSWRTTTSDAPRSDRRGGAAARLRDDGRRLGRGRVPRDHIGGSVARQTQGRAVDRPRRPADAGEPPRREGGRHRCSPCPTYGFVAIVYVMLGLGFVRCLSGCPQAATANLPLEATGAAGPVPGPEGVLLRRHRAHRRRGDLQRRPGLPATPGEERRHDARDDGGDDGHDVPGDHRHDGSARMFA